MHIDHPNIHPNTIQHRLYQERILATATTGNTLVVLPTGLGKTPIAVMLAAHRLAKGRIIILAPTKPLVQQHCQTLKKTLKSDVTEISGETGIHERKDLWKTQTICSTPQTLRNDLLRGADLSDVSLLVFDEAHRAVGNYAYGFIAQQYMKTAKDPLILALTASPGSDKNKVQEICTKLYIQHIEHREHDDPDVKQYVQDVDIEWRKIDLPPEIQQVRSLLKDMLKEPLSELKRAGYLYTKDLTKVNKRILLKIQIEAQKKKDYDAIRNSAIGLKVSHALELAETQSITVLLEYLQKLQTDESKSAQELLKTYYYSKLLETLKTVVGKDIEHPKKQELLKLVTRRCIIFTNYKSQASHVVKLLQDNGYNAEILVGKSGMTQKKQKEIVERFRQKEIEILVATSVGEEGLDIPSVDLVIFYEPVPSAIRMIQRTGRTARHSPGRVVVLVTKGTKDEAYLYVSENKQRKMMHNLLEVKPGQNTLEEYRSEDGIVVLADNRESNSSVVTELKKSVDLRLEQLDVGDYIVSDRVGIERKTAEDFLSSMIDKRLFEQVSNLKDHFERPILLIEGSDLYSRRAIHPNAIRGALASLVIDFRIPILYSNNETDTAGIIETLARREQLNEKRYPSAKGKRKASTLRDHQLQLVASLPSISLTLAERLLQHFKTPENLLTASPEDLSEVENIGKVKSETIRKIVTSEFQ